ncbi:Pre-mRNA-splicing factor cef1 [Linnemannia gamsii]|uniref:Pre-mRNA-splicing factor cef1 n=1 Tax=Linnemannia gamsii TaxID=64522 RepID=A0ABQ7KDQ1_9FUNG|nr:Pre-mRNA-splicing factor cef1 [Linnemannia gamsii]
MRIIIKGGVWKNTEDEILKAAVSKYGKNQWARISSLLVRKTASQCKARWMEWLDPSIRKTEWSREEDERLLHLAKLMPTQWRTIAPIVGRTASQCLERYQKLLDDAEQQAESDLGLAGVGDSGPSADDVRRLRPGEIDPDPETKPARPDPVDMDEDEKEMLSEARARLANTQGKKAKRKARERQLEEAHRLATLQKKRELKAAGIEMRQKKKKGMDYNADIPFEAKPAPGFYDTTEELKRESTKRLTNIRLEQVDGKRRSEVEEEERKKDAKRAKLKKDSGEAQAAQSQAQLRKLQEAEQDGIMRRKKMVLPAPHVGEAELEAILKIGGVADDAKALADGGDIAATKNLVGTYKSAGANLQTRTPRANSTQDHLMMEALNQRAMLNQQTPLLGGETPSYNVESGTGYDGITPRHSAIQTPNPYAATPRAGVLGGATPLRTPLRDELSINRGGAVNVMATPREEKMRQSSLRNQLLSGLANLPKPTNSFTLMMPEELEIESTEKVIEEDAAELAQKRKEAFEAEERARLLRRSQAVQRDLPRPTVFHTTNVDMAESGATVSPLAEADRLIQEELGRLISHDAVVYPPAGSKVAGGKQNAPALENLSDEYLALARNEVDQELLAPESKEKYEAFAAEFDEVWEHIQEEMKELQQIGLAAQFSHKRSLMTKQATKAGKLEKRLGVTLGGYQARSQTLATQLLSSHEELLSSELELSSFKNLRIMEEAAVSTRMEALNKEVTQLSSRETFLQQKWDGLNRERQDIVERIEKLHLLQQQKQQAGTSMSAMTEETAQAPAAETAAAAAEEDDDEDIGPQPMAA